MFYCKALFGKNSMSEKMFQFVLNEICCYQFCSILCFQCLVPGPSQQYTVAQVAEIIKAFVKMKSAFEWQFLYGRSYQYLSANRYYINFRK